MGVIGTTPCLHYIETKNSVVWPLYEGDAARREGLQPKKEKEEDLEKDRWR